MKKKIVAIVPVRKGSQRVVSKNTRDFAETNLLKLKLDILRQLKGIDEIIVSTDCEKCTRIAQENNIKVHIRDNFHSGSTVTNDEHWYHIADITPGDIVFMAQVTSPMVKVSTYQKAINKIIEDESIDSIVSVSEEKKFLWKDNKPINYDINRTPKSQDLPNIFSLNFAISIIDKDVMMKKRNVVGDRPYFLYLNKIESVDIDDIFDFEFAEFLYKKYTKEWLLTN
ncbi:cytidylyltransferase domain-containing protein [Campylobacter concisus]|uniref:acylneuraminate cytidylyltransferase family protein n=1 Tax=Campylobacter concisus TaxID=199 RepID=UPI000CD85CE1|nr:hypothetical protein [Campylobacter concisus]